MVRREENKEGNVEKKRKIENGGTSPKKRSHRGRNM